MSKIIVVDDSPVFRSTLVNVLQAAGHTVLGEGASADDVFKLLEHNTPDLLMLDLLMPGRSGLDVLKKLKQDRNSVNVLLVTAVNQQVVNQQAKELGAKGILYKPFDSEEMLSVVERLAKE